MLKQYAEAHKLGMNELTEKSIKQLRLFMLLGLPTTPLFGMATLGGFSDIMTVVLYILCFLSGFFLFAAMVHKVTNRFWARDKYLDEWEVQKKHHSMAIGFQVLSYVIVAVMILTGSMAVFTDVVFNISLRQIAIGFFGLLVLAVYVPLGFLLQTTEPISVSTNEVDLEAITQSDKAYKKLWFIMLTPCVIIGLIVGIYVSLNAG